MSTCQAGGARAKNGPKFHRSAASPRALPRNFARLERERADRLSVEVGRRPWVVCKGCAVRREMPKFSTAFGSLSASDEVWRAQKCSKNLSYVSWESELCSVRWKVYLFLYTSLFAQVLGKINTYLRLADQFFLNKFLYFQQSKLDLTLNLII